MKMTAITMVTRPDYRQDPYLPALKQMLEVFDEVVCCCGDPGDRNLMLADRDLGDAIAAGRLRTPYLHWPQPEWTFDQLPAHLNMALEWATDGGADWVVKLDVDTVVHEADETRLRNALDRLDREGKALGLLEKYQFVTARDFYEKGQMPLALNVGRQPTLRYGLIVDNQGSTQYSDLCRPGLDTGERHLPDGCERPMPKVSAMGRHQRGSTGVHAWNYDYTFKTRERAEELLYHFDRSHAAAWGAGFGGREPGEITRESAMAEFLALMKGRRRKCNKTAGPGEHPMHFREAIAKLRPEMFGHNHWGNI